MLPRKVSNAPTAAPATATPLKIAAAPHLPRVFSGGLATGTGVAELRAGTGRGVLRLVERGFGVGLAAGFDGAAATGLSATGFAAGTGFDATGLVEDVAAGAAFGALALRGARRRVTGFFASVSGVSVSATVIFPRQ